MASERFTIVDGRVMVEEDLLDALHISLTRPLEEVLTTLRKGSLLLKHGRHGRPKVHYFRLMQNDSLLCWRSSSGSVRGVDLRAVSSLVPGQSSDVFRRHPLPASAACSWTLTYTEPVTRARRTLDLTAESEATAAVWVSGLRLVRAVMTLPGYTQLSRRTSSLGSEGGGAPGGAATRRRSGPAPAQHHAGPSSVPCDLLVWGACSSVRAGSRPWVCSAAPEAAPGNGALDAATVAVGLSHGVLTTRCGAVYAWGRGAGGKLGLGHDRDAPAPERVGHALARERARAVAAGDDYSAALTARGALYMWGRLPGGRGQPETVPRLVRGCLGARPVAQVSCGPFHCAAVTADGELFTWGEGFGGRLGHGDVLPRAAPQRVDALAGLRVLEAACGVWHTAAIVAESARSAVAAEHNPLEASAAAAAAAAAAIAGSVGHLIAASSSGATEPGGAMSSAFADAAGQHAPHAPHGSLGLPLHAPPATPSSGSTRSHRRSSSGTPALSAPPVESSFFHEGVGGALYTWGGISEPVAYGDRQEKRDSNRGCLAHGDVDLYSGQLLPCRVHTPEPRSFRRVAAGAHLTVVVTTGGRVWQAGITGAHVGGLASGASGGAGFGSSGGAGALVSSASAALERRPAPSACPWEGATTLEPVRGALQGWFVDRIAAGMHHVLAAGRRLDARTGLPLDGVAAVFAWGRGAEGQLGAGARVREDSAAPVAIEHLRGRGGALAVAAGGSTSAAVLPHEAARFEADARDGAEATARALTGMLDGAGPASAPGSPSRRASTTSFGPAAFLPKSGSAPARALFRTSGLSTASSATSSASSSARRARPSIKLPVDAVLAGLRAAGPATFGGLGAARPPSIFRASANGAAEDGVGARRGAGGFPTGSAASRASTLDARGPAPPPAAPLRVVSIAGSPSSGSLASSSGASDARLGGAPVAAHNHPHLAPRPHSFPTPIAARAPAALERRPRAGSLPELYGGGAEIVDVFGSTGALERRGADSRQGSVGRDGLEAAASAATEPLGASGPPGLRLWSLEGLGAGSRPLSGASLRNTSGSLGATGAASPGTSLGSAHSGAAWHDALGSSWRRDGSSTTASTDDRLRARVLATADAYREAALDRRRRRERRGAGGRIAAGVEASTRTADGARAPRGEEDAGAGRAPAAEPPAPPPSAAIGDEPAGDASADAARMLARLPAWSDVASSAPDSSELDATICAMEVFLARKQADLADQERRLAEWAAELRLRELELQRRSSKLMREGGGGVGGPVAGGGVEAAVNGQAAPRGAISAQEKTPNNIKAASTTAIDRPVATGSTAGAPASPAGTSPFQSGGGAHGAASYASAQSRASSLIRELSGAPSPDGRPEWSEEVDPGVTVTYTAVGGAVRVRRIRFSRTAFTKESAAAWYEARRGELARRLAGMSAAARSAAFFSALEAADEAASRGSRRASAAAEAAAEGGVLEGRAGSGRTSEAPEATVAGAGEESEQGQSAVPASAAAGSYATPDTMPAPPAAPLGPAAPSLGRPARAHGHTLSFDVGSEYQESLERSAAGTPSADSPPVSPGAARPAAGVTPSRLGRAAAAADGAELRAGLAPPGQLFRPDRTPRAHPIDQASSDGGSGSRRAASSSARTETPRLPGTPPSLLRQLSARSAALQRQGSGRSALGAEGSVFATPFSPRSTPASAGSGPEESAGSSRSSAVRQLESALDRADAE